MRLGEATAVEEVRIYSCYSPHVAIVVPDFKVAQKIGLKNILPFGIPILEVKKVPEGLLVIIGADGPSSCPKCAFPCCECLLSFFQGNLGTTVGVGGCMDNVRIIYRTISILL